MSSIPFELNYKANIFCTVSPNLHVCFASSPCQSELSIGQFKFTVLLNISSKVEVEVSSSTCQIQPGDLMIIENSKHKYKISSKESEPVFLLRNFIASVDKK